MKKVVKENHSRSIIKSITFRIIATLTTGVLVFGFTGNFNIALYLMSIDALIKITIYYFHERIWDSIDWGKKN